MHISLAQIFPVQVNINVAPPYSVYLSQYTALDQEKVMVTALLRDPVVTSLDVKFRFTIQGGGITLTTNPVWNPQPYNLSGGITSIIPQEIIADYLKPQNLLIEGVNPQDFYRSGRLPEGFYEFKVEVVEYRRSVIISNTGRASLWLLLNEPPRIIFPIAGQKMKATNPQMLNFTWVPGGISSPLASIKTMYEFTLVELVDMNIDPAVAITTASNASKFMKTLDQTNLIYGPADMLLTPGKSYAVRVKAYNTDGYELFKNNGYSDVRTFTFGDACPDPISFILQSPKQSTFDVNVITDPLNTSWQARFRENIAGADLQSMPSNWTELKAEPSVTLKTIKGLKPETTYEVQVRGLCGEIASNYTQSQTVATSSMVDPNRVCSTNPTPFVADNAPPLQSLKKNDIFFAALFPIKVMNVKSQLNGMFSGSGIATLPLFNTSLAVTFDNIGINNMNQLTSGHVKVVRDELNINLFGDTQTTTGGSGETGYTTDGVGGNTTTYPPITDTITIPSVYDSLKVINETTVIIYPPNGGTAITVDLGGNDCTLLIPEDGNINNAQIVYDGASHPYNTGLGGQNGDDPKNFTGLFARFRAHEGQTHGFDSCLSGRQALKYNILSNYYKQLSISGRNYYLPWKALKVDLPEPVKLQIKQGTDKMPFSNLKVRQTGVGDLTPSVGSGTANQTYLLSGSYKGLEESVVASYLIDGNEQYAGGLYTATYGEENYKLYLVPFPGITIPDDVRGRMISNLNAIYSQAVVSWNVDQLKEFKGIDLGTNGLDWAEKDMLSSYNSEMNSVISAFKGWKPTADDDAFYLFVVPKFSENNVEGYMPRNRRFGFVTLDQLKDRTVAHELGHGAFNLKHTFSPHDWNISQGTTDNLMDYSEGTLLWKPQWDFIHNPEITTGLWDGMDEGAYSSGTIMFADVIDIINKIREANKEKKDELTIQLSTGTGKEDEHFELGNKDYTYLQMKTTGFNPLTGTQPTVTVQSGAGSAVINTARPSYNVKPSELSKTTYTENSIKFVKYVFHELQTKQNGAPYADTKVPTGINRIEISIKENESINFEEYLYAAEEFLIEGINWISQKNSTFSGETCWGPPNWCCCRASKYILSQFGVTPINKTCIAELSSSDDYSSVTPNSSFEIGQAILQNYIKPRDKGGEPILIGAHYPKTENPGYINPCIATFHYMIVVGKGYDPQKKQDYYRFYDVGRENEIDGTNPQNRLYVDKQNKTISSTYRGKTYTITEIYSNH